MKEAVRQFVGTRRAYSALVILPLFLLAIYLSVIATPRYLSEARVIVERDQSTAAAAIELAGISLGAGGGTSLDVQLVKRFIESPAMLAYLEKEKGYREHYSNPHADWIARLSKTATAEDTFDYYLDHVTVDLDKDSLTLDIATDAFDPGYAQQLANSIARRTEQFVNEVGQSLAREQVAFAQGEVDKAHRRMLAAESDIIAYQNKNELLSPEIESQSLSQVIAGLQVELARQRTELKAFERYLGDTAPEIIAARNKISALERQIEQERAKQVRTGHSAAMNDLMVKFKELELTLQVATDVYQAGLRTLEVAKLDASRKVKHLVMVSAPTLPDESTRPRRWYTWVTAFVLIHLLYLIGAMLVAIINDHRE